MSDTLWSYTSTDFRRSTWFTSTNPQGEVIQFRICEEFVDGRWEGFTVMRKPADRPLAT